MEIILLKDLEKVGDKFEVVRVKGGYARNFLIPQRLAVVANSTNKAKLADLIQREEALEAAKLDEYKAIAAKFSDITLRIGAKTGTSGKIFGSVTALQIAQALKENHDIEVERKKIEISDEVKTLGAYEAKVNLHKEVQAILKFEVVAE
jgi:large subunit ribosomal protein L9